jgi:hypothetical protein
LKKDIIKDIKKETRKKDYNSSNKNTTSSSLTDIVKSRREAGEGVFSSLGGAAKERLKEKLDIRRALPQGGLLTALFPKLRAYKAQLTNNPSAESAGVGATPVGGGDSLSLFKSLLDSINVSTKIISKNSMALPLIQKDSNLIAKTLRRIIRVMQIRRKVNPFAKKTTAILSKSYSAAAAPEQLEAEREEPKKEKNPIEKLLESIKETFSNLKTSITKTLTELPGKIITGIVDGMKGLFKITKFASAFLLSLLKPLLALIFSPVGFALLLAAGIFFSLYKLSKALNEVIAEKVPNMNVMSPAEAAALMKNANKKGLITQASAAAGRKTPFTYEEAVDYLKNQILDGPKIAEEGLKLVDEEKRLSGILKSGDKSKIEAEGGEESIKKKISELKIRIANLGGEVKIKQIVSESSSGIPVRVPSTSEMLSASDSDKSDQLVGKTTQGVRRENQINRRDSRVISENIDRDDNDIGKTIRINADIANTEKMNQEGYGKQSATSPLKDPFKSPNITSPSPSGDISVALTSGLQNDGPGPAIPINGSKTVPAAAYDKDEALDIIIKNIMEAQNPMNSANQDGPANSNETSSQSGRLGSPLSRYHPVVISHHNAMAMALQISQTG